MFKKIFALALSLSIKRLTTIFLLNYLIILFMLIVSNSNNNQDIVIKFFSLDVSYYLFIILYMIQLAFQIILSSYLIEISDIVNYKEWEIRFNNPRKIQNYLEIIVLFLVLLHIFIIYMLCLFFGLFNLIIILYLCLLLFKTFVIYQALLLRLFDGYLFLVVMILLIGIIDILAFFFKVRNIILFIFYGVFLLFLILLRRKNCGNSN